MNESPLHPFGDLGSELQERNTLHHSPLGNCQIYHRVLGACLFGTIFERVKRKPCPHQSREVVVVQAG